MTKTNFISAFSLIALSPLNRFRDRRGLSRVLARGSLGVSVGVGSVVSGSGSEGALACQIRELTGR
jgi:hypothetical protein